MGDTAISLPRGEERNILLLPWWEGETDYPPSPRWGDTAPFILPVGEDREHLYLSPLVEAQKHLSSSPGGRHFKRLFSSSGRDIQMVYLPLEGDISNVCSPPPGETFHDVSLPAEERHSNGLSPPGGGLESCSSPRLGRHFKSLSLPPGWTLKPIYLPLGERR